jgi:putative transposase
MMYPLVLDLAADAVPVTVTCRVLGFSTQAFHKWRKVPGSQRDWDDAHLINAARDIHAHDPAFGYRFIADELPGRGIAAGENRVARLCPQERIWSVFAKKLGLTKKAGPPVHDDFVDRQFTTHGADQGGSQKSPNGAPMRASPTSAPSRTSTRTGSSTTPSMRG